MTLPAKPLLPNGYSIYNNVHITRRVEKAFFTDIYELSDGNFLYLFREGGSEEIDNNAKKYRNITINTSTGDYLGIILPYFSLEELSKIIEGDNTNRGLACVAGMTKLKKLLNKDVIQPLKNPEKYKKFKLSLPNGILLFGPPGCGKTFIIRKMAEELNYFFLEVKHTDISSPFVHESAAKIQAIFEKAKINAPSIIFIDELEGIVPKREHLEATAQYKHEEVNEFLRQLNDAGKNKILVVGATNRPDLIDTAILRSGRMDKRIFVPPPDFEARKELFRLYVIERPHDENINYAELARMTEGYSCSDIELIVTEAARTALEENKSFIDQELLKMEILKSVSSLSKDLLENYYRFGDLERS